MGSLGSLLRIPGVRGAQCTHDGEKSYIKSDTSDLRKADILIGDGDECFNRGYYKEALVTYRKAIAAAKGALKDNNTRAEAEKKIAEINLYLQRLYYYRTSNTARAFAAGNNAINAPSVDERTAEKTFDNQRDMTSFIYSRAGVRYDQKRETQLSSDGKEVTQEKNETHVLANLDFNRLFPKTFERIGRLLFGLEYVKTDFKSGFDVTAPLITQKDIDKDPNMPDYLKDHKDQQYPLLDFKGKKELRVNLDYSFFTFDGLLGTFPGRIPDILPKVNLGLEYLRTELPFTLHKHYEYLPSTQDFYSPSEKRKLTTDKFTFAPSVEFGNIQLFPDDYQKTWFATPKFGGRVSVLRDRSGANVYSSLDDDNVPHDTSAIWAHSYYVALQIDTPRVAPAFKPIPFKQADWASRAHLNLKLGQTKDPTVDSENGMWPSLPSQKLRSLEGSVEWDCDMLLSGRTVDKDAIKLTVPFAVRVGNMDLGNKAGTGPSNYLSYSIGFRHRGLEGIFEHATSRKGSYHADTDSIFVGLRF